MGSDSIEIQRAEPSGVASDVSIESDPIVNPIVNIVQSVGKK
jgi:hypothetical protein